MVYDAFISYAHQDKAVCAAVEKILRSFSLHAFVDRYQLFSGSLTDGIASALKRRPTLVLITSKSAESSIWVSAELQFVRFLNSPGRLLGGQAQSSINIIIIQIGEGVASRLNLLDHKVIDISRRDLTALDRDEWFKDQLWLAVHSQAINDVVGENRESAGEWCQRQLPDDSDWIDFWSADWRRYLPEEVRRGSPRALLAPGGSGKSVLAAHVIRHMLKTESSSCPVVIEPELLPPGQLHTAVCRKIGARSPEVLIEHVDRMLSDGHPVLFLVDGLDRATESFPAVELESLLNLLASTGRLVITCRPETWHRFFTRLSVETVTVDLLDVRHVQRIIRDHTSYGAFYSDFLRIPFYLGELLRLQYRLADMPTTRTDLLSASWLDFRQTPREAVPPPKPVEHVLDCLAEAQLARMAYDIPRSELTRNRDVGFRRELERLEASGTIIRRNTASGGGVRLRHDLLDCFGIARKVTYGENAPTRREIVYQRASEDIGWAVLSMIVQIAVDHGDPALTREVFENLLDMFDKKKWGNAWMAHAWAATYVMRDRFDEFLPLILDCLQGETTSAPSAGDRSKASTLGPPARVTQEAASSLASTFDMIRDWRTAEPSRAVPVLQEGLTRWPMRRRFVEALAQYRSQDSLRALLAFSQEELAGKKDAEILCEVSKALGDLGSSFGATLREECSAVLREISGYEAIDARTRRIAIESMNMLNPKSFQSVPEVSEAEIIHNLRPFADSEKKVYTDWRVIKEYAELHAYSRITRGLLTTDLLNALVNALDHDQTYARVPVARCLGIADHSRARAALEAELLEPQLPSEVRHACLDALRQQILGASSSTVRSARRWFVLDASRKARQRMSDSTAEQLEELALNWTLNGDRLVSGDAFELVGCRSEAFTTEFVHVNPQAHPISELLALVTEEDRHDVGEGLEPKFRICSIQQPEHSRLRIEVTGSTWEEGVSFHRMLRRRAAEGLGFLDPLVERYLNGTGALPGIAVVHGILITSDGKVVLAQRPPRSAHAPGRWSVSYEEQITTSDFEDESTDAATAAALRGLREEFGITATREQTKVVGALMEMPILNPAVVVIVASPLTFDQIRDVWLRKRFGDDADELVNIDEVELSINVLRTKAHDRERGQLHPTSPLRLLMLVRWLESRS
ncbi:NACHT domain-containing protein [Nonomuraea sp. NPDC048892]|uniref:NACHT domain-containing protein n=1 Tax=Nonomuraea sp. NPDC048892 TaxID=3154624 RepID=UPI0033C6E51F